VKYFKKNTSQFNLLFLRQVSTLVQPSLLC